MSILGRDELTKRLGNPKADERLFVSPILSVDQIRDASIDIRLGYDFFTTKRGNIGSIDPSQTFIKPDRFRNRHRLNQREAFYLHPNELALAGTLEFFKLPRTLSASVTSRSKWGRLGLIIATATAVHPGFTGTITLELVNHGNIPLVLYPGLLVAQMIFYECVGATEYQSDELSGRSGAHPSDVRTDWQDDMNFWCRPVMQRNTDKKSI